MYRIRILLKIWLSISYLNGSLKSWDSFNGLLYLYKALILIEVIVWLRSGVMSSSFKILKNREYTDHWFSNSHTMTITYLKGCPFLFDQEKNTRHTMTITYWKPQHPLNDNLSNLNLSYAPIPVFTPFPICRPVPSFHEIKAVVSAFLMVNSPVSREPVMSRLSIR